MRSLKYCFLALIMVGVWSQEGRATILVYSDQTTFLTATGATADAPIPNVGAVPSPSTLGSLTYSLGPKGTQLFFGHTPGAEWSSLIPGFEIAISAFEDLNVSSASLIHSFGFQFHEPNNPASVTDGCFAPCFDSTFEVTLKNGATTVGNFTFNAPDATLAFVGVWSDLAFDKVEILEIVGGIDDEYYGQFFTGAQAPVPEPASLLLLASGLFLAAAVRRRRS